VHTAPVIRAQSFTTGAHGSTLPDQATDRLVHRLHRPYYYCRYLSSNFFFEDSTGDYPVNRTLDGL